MGIKTDKLVLRTSKKAKCPSNSNFKSGLHYFHRGTRLKNKKNKNIKKYKKYTKKICKSIGIVGENINV